MELQRIKDESSDKEGDNIKYEVTAKPQALLGSQTTENHPKIDTEVKEERKVDITGSLKAVATSNPETPFKRKRGRPRKSESHATEISEAPAKRRHPIVSPEDREEDILHVQPFRQADNKVLSRPEDAPSPGDHPVGSTKD